MKRINSLVCGLLLLAMPLRADTLVNRLLEGYESIETVSCDVRRDLSNKNGEMRWLSRVYYQRPDRLHVENHAPLPRRIIADGETMYQHNENHPRGFRSAIDDLNETMLGGLRKVPGTVMDQLFRLQDAPEIELEGEGEFPVWRAYETDSVYVVLQADEEGRLGRVELYPVDDRDTLKGEIDLDSFVEVMDGVWIPMLHRGRFVVDSLENEETTRISNYVVNEAIPDPLFQPDAFFEDVEWVDSFDDL